MTETFFAREARDGRRGGSFRRHRQVVEGIPYWHRCGIAWR